MNKDYLELLSKDVKRIMKECNDKRIKKVIIRNKKIKTICCKNTNKVLIIRCENSIEEKVLSLLLSSFCVVKIGDDEDRSLVDLFFKEGKLVASYKLWSPIETNGYIRNKRAITFKEFKNKVSDKIRIQIQMI